MGVRSRELCGGANVEEIPTSRGLQKSWNRVIVLQGRVGQGTGEVGPGKVHLYYNLLNKQRLCQVF